jgi:hypothetical protein
LPAAEFTVSIWFKAEETHAGELNVSEQVLFLRGRTIFASVATGNWWSTCSTSTPEFALPEVERHVQKLLIRLTGSRAVEKRWSSSLRLAVAAAARHDEA